MKFRVIMVNVMSPIRHNQYEGEMKIQVYNKPSRVNNFCMKQNFESQYIFTIILEIVLKSINYNNLTFGQVVTMIIGDP